MCGGSKCRCWIAGPDGDIRVPTEAAVVWWPDGQMQPGDRDQDGWWQCHLRAQGQGPSQNPTWVQTVKSQNSYTPLLVSRVPSDEVSYI